MEISFANLCGDFILTMGKIPRFGYIICECFMVEHLVITPNAACAGCGCRKGRKVNTSSGVKWDILSLEI